MKTWSMIQQDTSFWKRLSAAPQCAFLFDYDGTLAPFVSTPSKAFPYAEFPPLLLQLMQQPRFHVSFITGRASHELLRLLRLPVQPEIWGSHGAERLLPSGEVTPFYDRVQYFPAFDAAVRLAGEAGFVLNVERKPACVAFHLRSLPAEERRDAEQWALEHWGKLAEQMELELHGFDGGLELRVPGISKGRAVETVRRELPEQCEILYFGDDLTDEDAFEALGHQGLSFLIRPRFRETQAQYWLRPPRELAGLLERILES